MPTSARVVTDSISESGIRLVTLVLEYPRIIHSEVMTHRMFSRNASSSRAIPVEKQIKRVEKDPFIPTYWGKNQKGMQASEQTNTLIKIPQPSVFYDSISWDDLVEFKREDAWLEARDKALDVAKGFNEAGYHKQLANRLLEPFSHIQVVVTATEWDNFFLQRLDKNAQPEIQELARVMKEAMNTSTPKLLKASEWHLPFVDLDISSADFENIAVHWESIFGRHGSEIPEKDLLSCAIKLSVARCARVSYGLNERGWGDIEKDLALYDMLLTNNHWSPFEHQATPSNEPEYFDQSAWDKGITHIDRNYQVWSGNFKGWIQNRQLIQQL